MKTLEHYYHHPETCTAHDWLDGWNRREFNVYVFFSGLGSCVGRYPIDEAPGFIENNNCPCRDRDVAQEEFRRLVAQFIEDGDPVFSLATNVGGKVTREQLLQMDAYFKMIDSNKPAE